PKMFLCDIKKRRKKKSLQTYIPLKIKTQQVT
ncbi:MAG: hypothetical protein ACI8VT_004345, partial [Saprospiraceae bacterium]